jgi:hypothetical protein
MRFKATEVNILRELDHDAIDISIERRRAWYEEYKQRWSYLPAVVPQGHKITPEAVTELHAIAELLNTTSIDFKLVTSGDWAWLYTNNTDLYQKLLRQHQFKDGKFTCAVINRAQGTVLLKNPQHSHRSYFKYTKLEDTDIDNLHKFFLTQQNNIRLCPSLVTWMSRPQRRIYENYFIDHTGLDYTLMMSLIYPGIVRKTLAIVARE